MFWRKRAETQRTAAAVFDLKADPWARLSSVGLEIDGRTILQDLTLELREARIGIVGLNGSGKSSFIRLLNGLRQPTSGNLEIFGVDAALDPAALPRHVGFVFQNPDHQAIFPIVEEDVAFGLTQLGRPRDEALAAARTFLADHGAGHLAARPIADLSEGQKQLVAILAVLIMQPAVILLDEPFSALDGLAGRRLQEWLAALPQRLVLISHDRAHLQGFERILWIEDGRLRGDGDPATVLAAYDREIERRASLAGPGGWSEGHL